MKMGNSLFCQYSGVSKTHGGQQGIGLVELMVAMVLGLFLIGGVIQIFIGTKSSYRVMEGMSRLQENARYAMSTISREINAAGYMGCLDITPQSNKPDKITNTLSNKTVEFDFAIQVTGSDGTATPPADTLTIRRAVATGNIAVIEPMASQVASITLDDADPDYAALEQYQVLTVGDCEHAAVFMVTNDPSGSGGVIEHDTGVTAPLTGINPGQSNASTDLEHTFGAETISLATVYRSRSSTFDIDPATGSLRLNGDELIRGVSDMQVEYGLPSGTNTRYVTAGSVADWSSIEAIRVTLVFDTVEAVTTSNQKIDRTYTTTFRLRNRAPDKS